MTKVAYHISDYWGDEGLNKWSWHPPKGLQWTKLSITSTGKRENGEQLECVNRYNHFVKLFDIIYKSRIHIHLPHDSTISLLGMNLHTQQKCGPMFTKRYMQEGSQQHHCNSPMLKQPNLPTNGMDKETAMNYS